MEVIIVSGPSGVGKSTVVKELLEHEQNLERTVSATTRHKREDDQKKRKYHYLSREEFREKIENGDFVEWAEVHGNYYGTLASEIERISDEGKIPVLEIDVQGAEQIRQSEFKTLSIFLEPPTWESLKERLQKRGTNTEEELEARLKTARKEMDKIPEYDYRIVNDKVSDAVERIRNIIHSQEN